METFFTAGEQSVLFLASVAVGCGLGPLYDVFRALRLLIPHRRVFVAIEDIFFLSTWALVLITFSLEWGRGEVRGFYFIGNLLGFTLYFFTLGHLILGILRRILGFIGKILGLLRIPVKKLGQAITKWSQKIKGNFVKYYGNRKKSKNASLGTCQKPLK